MLSVKDKQGIKLIVGSGAVLATLVVLALALEEPKAGDDNCIGSPRASTVVIIDNSQKVSEQTRREIISRVESIVRDSVEDNERVSLFRVSAMSSDSLTPVITLCKPRSSGNELYEDDRAIRTRFKERFELPLSQALQLPLVESSASPIAEAVIDLSLSTFLRSEKNRVVLFSDLVEHTPSFSLYGCTSGDVAIESFRRSRRGAQERPQFRNTHVVLNVVPRTNLPEKTTSECRDKFWMWFFGDNVGGSLTPDFLPGQ